MYWHTPANGMVDETERVMSMQEIMSSRQRIPDLSLGRRQPVHHDRKYRG